MIAIIIVSAIILIIVALLFIPIGFDIFYSKKSDLVLKSIIGPVRITLLPEKQYKINYKKKAKSLRNIKLADVKNDDEKSAFTKPEAHKIKKKLPRTNSVIENFINSVCELSDDPQSVKFFLIAFKELSEKFNKYLSISLKKLNIRIDTGDAAKTCIVTGVLNQLLSVTLNFLNNNSKLKISDSKNNSVVPSFDNSGNSIELSVKIEIGLIHIISSFLKTFINNPNIKVKKEIKK